MTSTESPDIRPGDRAGLLAEAFVMLADTLVDDFDVVDLLHSLATTCVDLLGATDAGILLDDQRGNLAVVASSSEESRLLEVLQLQSDQGPCMDCVRTGKGVVCVDLAGQAARWPLFVPAALAAGITSVVALPLRLRSVTIGALNIFHDVEATMTPDDQRLAQALADVATIGILQQRSAHRTARLAEQLQHALNSRVVIEQAKGVLAERRGVNMDAAFDELRRNARNTNSKLADYARVVVRGDVEAVPPPV
jgi:GAF domain-containing protein